MGLTLLPATVFLRRLPAMGGEMAPGISRVLEHIATKFQRPHPPMFSGSVHLMVVLPVLWEVDVCSKSKMAAKLPEVPITMLVLQIHVVSKIIQGFMTMYETSKCPAIMADATSCRKSKMAAN